ncbi:MAG: hypothetical protein DRP56_10720, partial [Planctomycetota bacterium]
MQNKNILAVIESHVDKIVLAACILVSMFLLWIFVISNPYGEKVKVRGRQRKLGPSEIDRYVKQEAETAVSELDKPAPPMPPHGRAHLSEYDRLLQSSISEISSSARFPSPGAAETPVQEDRTYALPAIPSLAKVAVGRLRGAAEVPIEDIGPDHPYASAATEVADIDFVTVSAWLDVQALYNNFQQSFMGPRLKTSWKDTHLATPVFARLQAQRRTRMDNGDWGKWEQVSRTEIDSQRKLLEELPLVLDEASFGVGIWMSQYESQDIQHDILQPESYSFTVSRTEWMAPEFLDETLKIMKKQAVQAERERKEELRSRRSAKPTDTRRRTTGRRPGPGAGDGGFGMMMPGGDNPVRTTRATARKERGVDDVQKDFEKELLNEKSIIRSRRESLLVWAHDDTAQPGKTYQYRIRIGVFNPIAGKDWFQSDQADYKGRIVLWSDYSQPTAEVSVPKRIYVFPMDVVADKDAKNTIQGVQVEVAKYYLGQWRDFDFDIYPGEVIGYEVEDVEEADDMENVADSSRRASQEPDKVDFTSDATLVDVVREVVWGSRLRPGASYKMLYYDAEKKMQKAAVGKSNWHSDMR